MNSARRAGLIIGALAGMALTVSAVAMAVWTSPDQPSPILDDGPTFHTFAFGPNGCILVGEQGIPVQVPIGRPVASQPTVRAGTVVPSATNPDEVIVETHEMDGTEDCSFDLQKVLGPVWIKHGFAVASPSDHSQVED